MLVTIDVLKAHLGGIQTSLNFNTVVPFVKVAERTLRGQIGADVLAWLEGLASPTGATAELKELAQGYVAWTAYDQALPHLKVRVGDLGMAKTIPQNSAAVTKWEYVDTREANLAMADAFLESFFELLESEAPQAWKDSPQYAERRKCLIQSATELAKHVSVAGRNARFFDKLLPYLGRAEALYIEPVVTPNLLASLKAAWQNPLQGWTAEDLRVVEAIRQALAPLALYEAYPYLPLRVDESGLSDPRSKDGTREELKASEVYADAQRRQLYQDGQLFLARLRRVLDELATPTRYSSYYLANQVVDAEEDFSNKPHVVL